MSRNPITVLPQSIQDLIDDPDSRIDREHVDLDIDQPGSDSDESDFGSDDSVVSEADRVLVTDSDEEPLGQPNEILFPTFTPTPNKVILLVKN